MYKLAIGKEIGLILCVGVLSLACAVSCHAAQSLLERVSGYWFTRSDESEHFVDYPESQMELHIDGAAKQVTFIPDGLTDSATTEAIGRMHEHGEQLVLSLKGLTLTVSPLGDDRITVRYTYADSKVPSVETILLRTDPAIHPRLQAMLGKWVFDMDQTRYIDQSQEALEHLQETVTAHGGAMLFDITLVGKDAVRVRMYAGKQRNELVEDYTMAFEVQPMGEALRFKNKAMVLYNTGMIYSDGASSYAFMGYNVRDEARKKLP